jgi:hypothetical protein
LALLHGLLTVPEVARQFEFNSLHQAVWPAGDDVDRFAKSARVRRLAGEYVLAATDHRIGGGNETLREITCSYNVSHSTISKLTVCGLTANECDRDMPHRRIGLGAMPMAFTGLDMHDITHVDLTLFMLRCHHAGA